MRTNYVNTTEILQLYIYDNGSRVSADAEPTISAVDANTGDAVTMSAVTTQNHSDGYDYYETFVDPSEVTYARNIRVTWSYTYSGSNYTKIDLIEVVAPYFDADDLWSFNDEYAAGGALPQTLDDAKRIESIVRGIINAYTGEEFQDYGKTTRTYFGNGSNTLQIHDMMYKLYTVTGGGITLFDRDINGDVQTDIVTWDNKIPHVITRKAQLNTAFFDIKADVSPGLLSHNKVFKSGTAYDVEADFGWKDVPSDVSTAALILASDYIEENDIYHQKNITVVRSADYRMEFGNDHHTTTGNVHADNLLQQFSRTRMEII